MRIIHNRFFPAHPFGLINILGMVFTQLEPNEVSDKTKRHEAIHTPQQYELLTLSAIVSLVMCNIYTSWWYLALLPVVPFAIYILMFVIELLMPPYHNAKECFAGKAWLQIIEAIPTWIGRMWMHAYQDNCFEREAYQNEHNPDYLVTRPLFAWLGYIIPMRKR